MKIDQMKRIFRSRLVNSSWLALSALILFSAVETPAGTNTLEKVERAETVQISQTSSPDQEKIKAEIFEFIDAWGKAWSPKENAPQFSRTLIAPFYLQSEELLGFDFTDAESRTVFQGVQIHHDTWEAFVRGYDYWTFTPVTKVFASIHNQTEQQQ